MVALLPNHAQPHALKLLLVEPSDLLPKPGFRAGELVLLNCSSEVARTEQVGDRSLARLAEPIREPTSARRCCQNHRLARKVSELAEVSLVLHERLGPAVSLAEQGDRSIQVADAEHHVLDTVNRRSLHARRSLDAPRARR